MPGYRNRREATSKVDTAKFLVSKEKIGTINKNLQKRSL